MSGDRIIQVILGCAAGAGISLAAWALSWVFDANADIKTMQETADLKFEQMAEVRKAEVAEIQNTINLKFDQMNEILKLKFEDIEDSLITLGDDSADITRITKTLVKHWKFHSWTKDQIAELRHKTEMEPVPGPNLGP